MPLTDPASSAFELQQASSALQRGDRSSARLWAEQALRNNPNEVKALIILAGISKPEECIIHLKRVLEIDPQNEYARRGMHWAVEKVRQEETYRAIIQPESRPQEIPSAAWQPEEAPEDADEEDTQPVAVSAVQAAQPVPLQTQKVKLKSRRKRGIFLALLPWIIAICVFCLGITIWAGLANNWLVLAESQIPVPLPAFLIPTATPTITSTPTLTPTTTSTSTPTSTATFTPTSTSTSTPTPTFTSTPTITETPVPPTETTIPVIEITPISEAEQLEYSGGDINYSFNDFWIEVNLSQQMAYAYNGETLLASFSVSTGTWEHPTVTGTYSIYVMYRYADMSGPGYYLTNVPYVMYFYKGYGLHGTYWHSNFGVPMSHGCVNFSIPDAAWIYERASIGTVVNVHY